MATSLSPNRTIRSKSRKSAKGAHAGNPPTQKQRCHPDDPFIVSDKKNPNRVKFCTGKLKGKWLKDAPDSLYLVWVLDNIELTPAQDNAVRIQIRWLNSQS